MLSQAGFSGIAPEMDFGVKSIYEDQHLEKGGGASKIEQREKLR
jgi:hypothetical protein